MVPACPDDKSKTTSPSCTAVTAFCDVAYVRPLHGYLGFSALGEDLAEMFHRRSVGH